jgi:hypothetical protein
LETAKLKCVPIPYVKRFHDQPVDPLTPISPRFSEKNGVFAFSHELLAIFPMFILEYQQDSLARPPLGPSWLKFPCFILGFVRLRRINSAIRNPQSKIAMTVSVTVVVS